MELNQLQNDFEALRQPRNKEAVVSHLNHFELEPSRPGIRLERDCFQKLPLFKSKSKQSLETNDLESMLT